jgi:hypothetical protein
VLLHAMSLLPAPGQGTMRVDLFGGDFLLREAIDHGDSNGTSHNSKQGASEQGNVMKAEKVPFALPQIRFPLAS